MSKLNRYKNPTISANTFAESLSFTGISQATRYFDQHQAMLAKLDWQLSSKSYKIFL